MKIAACLLVCQLPLVAQDIKIYNMPANNRATGSSAEGSATQFWDQYFSGRALAMTRDLDKGCTWSTTSFPSEPGKAPFDFEVKHTVQRRHLLKYDYDADVRFSLGIYPRLPLAMVAVISAPLMQKETIPNQDQLRYVFELLGQPVPAGTQDYAALRQLAIRRLQARELSIESAGRSLTHLKPGAREYREYKATGQISALHAQREIVLKSFGILVTNPKVSELLKAVIDNQQNEDVQSVKIALWAMGRQNDKHSLQYLLQLLTVKDYAFFRVDIERAVQFICSGRDLISLSDDEPFDYWRKQREKLPQADAQDAWADHDARSIFWEKRLRCAVEWKAKSKNLTLVARLAVDEVLPVRAAAGGPQKLIEE